MQQGIRARNRAALLEAMTETANRQLTQVGPSEFRRAVARELGMASSAIYRYESSRDELLTLLIVSAYEDMAEAVEQSASTVRIRTGDGCPSGGMPAVGARATAAVRIHGSPVPGYAAPQNTIAPATRTRHCSPASCRRSALSRRCRSVHREGRTKLATSPERRRAVAGLSETHFNDAAALALGIMAWTHYRVDLLGTVRPSP